MHPLVPVIQLGNRNRENKLKANSEETVAFAWMRSFQDTSKFQEQTWGRQDSHRNVPAKRICWFQSSNLEIEIKRTHWQQILRRQSYLLECGVSKTLSNSKNGHEVVKLANKMCQQKCIWFQSASYLKIETVRKHWATANSEETVIFAWTRSFQDPIKFQERTWVCQDSQQNVSEKCTKEIKQQHTDFCLVDLLYLPGYYNSTPCITAS